MAQQKADDFYSDICRSYQLFVVPFDLNILFMKGG